MTERQGSELNIAAQPFLPKVCSTVQRLLCILHCHV